MKKKEKKNYNGDVIAIGSEGIYINGRDANHLEFTEIEEDGITKRVYNTGNNEWTFDISNGNITLRFTFQNKTFEEL